MNAIDVVTSRLSDGSEVYDVVVDGHIVHYACDLEDAVEVYGTLKDLAEHLNGVPLLPALAAYSLNPYHEARPTSALPVRIF